MTERVKRTDRVSSAERLRYYEGLVGLQARLLMGGETLNPHKLDLAAITKESLGNFDQRNYSPFINASTRERKTYWKGKENDRFEEQKKRWTNNLVSLFDQNKQFFREDKEGKQWSGLFSQLEIDTQHFTQEKANQLYDKYFTGEKKESNIKKFVADVVNTYRGNNNQIDYQRLKHDLSGIQWLAHIFGDVSSEIIAQLIDAEVKLQIQPEELVRKANEQQQNVLRLNNLLPKEKELLTFLWNENQNQETRHIRIKWEYRRLGDPRIFPDEFSFLEQAKMLKQYKPGKYDRIDDEILATDMEQESKNLQKLLVDYGLPPQELHHLTIGYIDKEVLSHYRQFVQSHYGVTLPVSEKIEVIPIWGKMSELHNPTGRALAFVTGLSPHIFLDFTAIANAAKHLSNKEWNTLNRDELGDLMKRLIREIKPHEYTHLMSDLAYWSLVAEETGKQDQTLLSRIGKLGLLVAKRPKTTDGQSNFSERGRGLMEAVTVELTRQWARNMNANLDLPAYPAQRQVLYTLRNKLHFEEKLSTHDVFKKFVQGYFDRKGFYDLVKFVNHNRPHYLSILYGLMDYEERKAGKHSASPLYSITVHYIDGSLDQFQKKEILNNLGQMKLAPGIKKYLQTQLS